MAVHAVSTAVYSRCLRLSDEWLVPLLKVWVARVNVACFEAVETLKALAPSYHCSA